MLDSKTSSTRVQKVVVATSVMLTFISFWRAAAIVLADLGSSAFYVGGIAEQAVGKAAAWFILGVMLFSYCVRAVYVESCAMFTRGGVYRVVKEAMGGTLAKLSVSALMFDYILTGPISGVSAGQYLVGLAASTAAHLGINWHPDKDTVNLLAASLAALVTIYFWWRNTKGIHESSEDALRIMYLATLMAVVMLLWAAVSIAIKPDKQRLPPAPVAQNLSFSEDAVGWLPSLLQGRLVKESAEAPASLPEVKELPAETRFKFPAGCGALLSLLGLMIAFGHSVLAMSGEETLAQVNRELEHPKHENLMRAGLVIFIYSLIFTSLVSFFAYSLIPDAVRPQYYDNLISGIAMNLAGPEILKLLFQGFIVVVGFLMLAGAVNTSIIGSNGVLNRVSEDGVLTDWFRAPHKRYGTTYRMINLIVVLQLLTIIGSRGEVYALGEAYAFGVVWSFAFKGLAMLVLRFTDKSEREWKVPGNLSIAGTEIPFGLGAISLFLFAIALINIFSKEVATISGLALTAIFFAIFSISEHLNEKKRGHAKHVELDQFRLSLRETVDSEAVEVRPANKLCLVRDYTNLDHLRRTMENTDTANIDVVVLTIHMMTGPDARYRNMDEQTVFTEYEQLLFSRVVAIAEKAGKRISLLVIPSINVYSAIVQTAIQLQSAEVILGHSSVLPAAEQAMRLGHAFEDSPQKQSAAVHLIVYRQDGQKEEFDLGAHAPNLSSEEIYALHNLWLEMVQVPGIHGVKLHHSDVVKIALLRLKRDFEGIKRGEVLQELETVFH